VQEIVLEATRSNDNPNKVIIIPVGMKPAQFIKVAFGVPVAPSSLMK